METMVFIYNIVLIVLFSVVLTLALSLYAQKKHTVYLIIGVLFFFYILDNTIISMTELIDSFSHRYDKNFMSVPAFKTVVILVYSTCSLYILSYLLKRKMQFREHLILMLIGVFLLFVPMLENGALMVWMFYMPAQVYLFYLSAGGLYYLRKNENQYEKEFYRGFKHFLFINLVFSLLIIIEDTIVIFNFDTYSNLVVKINNRNISEDVLSVIYVIYALLYMNRIPLENNESDILKLSFSAGAGSVPAENTEVFHKPLGQPGLNSMDEAAGRETGTTLENREDKRHVNTFIEFCDLYQLTSREREILEILLQDKNNQEICEACNISIGTVKTHVHNIFTKVNVAKRSQLIRTYHEFVSDKPGYEGEVWDGEN